MVTRSVLANASVCITYEASGCGIVDFLPLPQHAGLSAPGESKKDGDKALNYGQFLGFLIIKSLCTMFMGIKAFYEPPDPVNLLLKKQQWRVWIQVIRTWSLLCGFGF